MKLPDGIPPLAFKINLLKITDWTQLPDVDLTAEEKTAWATWRQQVRDMPKINPIPNQEIEFPDPPYPLPY